MMETARTTRSATRLKKSEDLELSIKKEEDTKTTNASTNQHKTVAGSSSDSIVEVEETDTDLKAPSPKFEEDKGWYI